jgi:hypothetical protein
LGSPTPVARWLFAAFACFYLLCTAAHINTPDGVIMFRVTRSFVERGSADVEPIDGLPTFGGQWVPQGTEPARFYAWFGPGLSAAAAPSYGLGVALWSLATENDLALFRQELGRPRSLAVPAAGDAPPSTVAIKKLWYGGATVDEREGFLSWVVTWTNAVLSAATVAALYLITRRLGFGDHAALSTAAAGGLATPLWPYAKTFFSEPLAAAALTWFLYFALDTGREGARRSAALFAGLALGVMLLARVATAVLLLPAGLLLLWLVRELPRPEAARRLAMAAVGVAAGLAALLAYNAARFGSPLATGYGANLERWSTPLLEGLVGLLVSPGRGLVLYVPLLVLTALVARRFPSRPVLAFSVSCAALLALVYARWFMWEGGWCWGPRFLLPAVPLLVLPLASFFETSREGPLQAAGLVLLALSFLVAASGASIDFSHFHQWIRAEARQAMQAGDRPVDYYELVRWSWLHSPLLRAWDFGLRDYFLLPHALRWPGLVTGLYAAFAAGLAGSGLGLRGALRRSGGDHLT